MRTRVTAPKHDTDNAGSYADFTADAGDWTNRTHTTHLHI